VKLVIGSDHAGFPLKEEVRVYLAKPATRWWTWVRITRSRRTILTLPRRWVWHCSGAMRRADSYLRFGRGVCVAANKIPGIRAGMCHDTYSAHQAWSTTT